MKKIALITGATSGIGRATALKMAKSFPAKIIFENTKNENYELSID